MFKKLAVMTKIQNKIETNCLKSNGFNERPCYLSVVRDFTLKPQYTPQEDIDRFLKLDDDPEKTKENSIRRSMSESFKSLKCFRLTPPAYKLQIHQNLEQQKFQYLETEFQEAFVEMCRLIQTLLTPKCIDGKPLNGFTLSGYVKIIVKLINEEKVVHLYDTMTSLVELETKYFEMKYLEILNDFQMKLR